MISAAMADPVVLRRIRTFAQFCADLEALRIHLGYDRIALLGHSYGGFIALEYAWRYPERVSHLILVDTVAATNFDDAIRANLQRINPPPEALAALASEPTTDAELQQVLQTIMPLYFHTFDAARVQAAFQHIVWSVTANSAGFAFMSDYNMLPHLGEILAPTLCVVGDSDFLALVPHVQRLARAAACRNGRDRALWAYAIYRATRRFCASGCDMVTV